MKDYEQYEQEVLAAVGKLLVSKLKGRDDLAHSIFDALIPEFRDRYPYHKILAHTVLGQVPERDETKEELIARVWGRGKPIKTADDHRAALKEIEGLMAAKIDTPEGNRLDILATLVEAYESNTITEGQLVDREDWQEYSAAMSTIATAVGTTVYCHQKNNRLAVDFRSDGLTDEQLDALAVIENLVELVSEFPAGYLEQLKPPGQ